MMMMMMIIIIKNIIIIFKNQCQNVYPPNGSVYIHLTINTLKLVSQS